MGDKPFLQASSNAMESESLRSSSGVFAPQCAESLGSMPHRVIAADYPYYAERRVCRRDYPAEHAKAQVGTLLLR